MLGIKAQKTLLGTYEINGKTKIVCACKDFTADGKRLFDFCSIKNTILESDSGGSGTELSDVLDAIDKQQYIPPKDLREHFWNVFVADALLGNFDRHNGNWGFLFDDVSGHAEIAPIYDCGSCLLPQADEDVMRKVLTSEDFLTECEYDECMVAVMRIAPRVNLSQIGDLIDNTPYISDLQKAFYKRYIGARFEQILEPAYKIAMSDINESGPIMTM